VRPLIATRRRRWYVIAVLLFVVVVAVTSHRYFRPAPKIAPAHSHAVASDKSLYLLDSVWTTDRDKTIRLGELRGYYVVMALIFTECNGVCSVMVKELQTFSTSLPRDIKNQTRFVAITIDPDDTGEALLHYRQEMQLDEPQWMLLRSTPAAVRELAAVLGFNYAQTDNRQFSHSNLLTLLNPSGEIIHQQQGAGSDLRELTAAIHKE
jgi:protein SCO1/2